MTFAKFAQFLQELENISSRLEMTAVLAKLLAELDVEEVDKACYLMQGSLVPAFQSLEFQLSEKMIIKALARIETEADRKTSVDLFGEQDYAKRETEIWKDYKKQGDLGKVVESIKLGGKSSLQKNESKQLNILEIYHQLKKIAEDGGTGSQDRKVGVLASLLSDLDNISAKYVVRIVLGKMRLGFSTMTIIDALSWAVVGDKSEREELERAYNKKADIGSIAKVYLSHQNASIVGRQKQLEQIEVEVGVPVIPALCQRLETAQEVVDKMGVVLVEPKYDGMRVQIHVHKIKNDSESDSQDVQRSRFSWKVKAFTRNLDDVTHMFPELNQIGSFLQADSVILDAEVIGFDPNSGELLPFQFTATRRRKHHVADKASEIPVKFFIFDLLKLNNQSIVSEKLQQRKDLLQGVIKENEVFIVTEYIQTKDPKEIQNFHNQKLAEGLEGVVIKKKNGDYMGGRKGWRWVKIKEAEGQTGKLKDTLDCIVMGYYRGRGKRTQFGLGAILVGLQNKQSEEILTVAKIGTGMSDELLESLGKKLANNKLDTKPKQYQVDKNLYPDVWVSPDLVVEIAADEITTSPIHTAGVALRFPRLIKIRVDKNWQQATNISELKNF